MIRCMKQGGYSSCLHFYGFQFAIFYMNIDATQLLIEYLQPDMSKKKTKICPVCQKDDQVIPITYGLPDEEAMIEAEHGKIILGGCIMTNNSPICYCVGDKKKF